LSKITTEQLHEIAIKWSNRKFADGAARFIEDFGREVIIANDELAKASDQIACRSWRQTSRDAIEDLISEYDFAESALAADLLALFEPEDMSALSMPGQHRINHPSGNA
jgi:hypothetical protein